MDGFKEQTESRWLAFPVEAQRARRRWWEVRMVRAQRADALGSEGLGEAVFTETQLGL